MRLAQHRNKGLASAFLAGFVLACCAWLLATAPAARTGPELAPSVVADAGAHREHLRQPTQASLVRKPTSVGQILLRDTPTPPPLLSENRERPLQDCACVATPPVSLQTGLRASTAWARAPPLLS